MFIFKVPISDVLNTMKFIQFAEDLKLTLQRYAEGGLGQSSGRARSLGLLHNLCEEPKGRLRRRQDQTLKTRKSMTTS